MKIKETLLTWFYALVVGGFYIGSITYCYSLGYDRGIAHHAPLPMGAIRHYRGYPYEKVEGGWRKVKYVKN